VLGDPVARAPDERGDTRSRSPRTTAVAQLAAGALGVCAALRSGRVVCWRLLDPSTALFSPPRPVAGVEGVRAVAVGGAHACALVAGGAVWCWGANGDGQSGVEARAAARDLPPAAVADLPPAVDVSAGARHTCARAAGGEVWCWGANRSGQLGCGPFAGGPRPQRVIDISDVEAVSAGRGHSCAVLPGAAVACWGDNRTRAVGAIEPRVAPVPVAIPGVTATQVTASCEATCARGVDGAVVCWGGRYRAPGGAAGRPVAIPLR
jgi:hypothetical protein